MELLKMYAHFIICCCPIFLQSCASLYFHSVHLSLVYFRQHVLIFANMTGKISYSFILPFTIIINIVLNA